MAPLYARPGQEVCIPAPVFKSLSPLYKCGDGFGTTPTDYVSYPTGRYFSVQEDTVFYAIWLPDPDYSGGSLRYRDTDVWVDGISVGADDWKELKYLTGENFFMAVRNENSGWYDVYQGFKNYCWAACASNAFHWWFDRNKSYLERYTYSGPSSLYGGFGKSDIYDYFTRFWPNEGGYPPAGFNWFLIGNSTVEGGAFFKDVFGNTGLQTEYTTPKQNNFSLSLEKALSAGEIIVLQVGEEQFAHAVTLWGARFDKDGFVDGNLTPDFYRTALAHRNRFIREYFRFDLNVRNTKVRYLNGALGRDPGQDVIVLDEDGPREEFEEEARLDAILHGKDILERERGIDDLMWEKIDEMTTYDYFDLEAVLGFLAKLHIVERWYILDEKTGREMFRKLVDEVRGTFKGVQFNAK